MLEKSIITLFGIITFIICYLLYYQFLYKSNSVESNIFLLNKIINNHNSDVWAVKFSPDGNYLASGSVDSTVKVWSKNKGDLVNILKQPSGVTYLDFSKDGNYLATSAYDGIIRLWKSHEYKLIKEFIGHEGTAWTVAVSPDNKTIASGGEDTIIKLWNLESGKLIKNLSGHKLNVWDIKFNPDGSLLASGSFDNSIKIWDTKEGKLIKTIYEHSEAVVALAFSKDGKKLCSVGDDKTIKLWNTDDWSLINSIEVPEYVQAVDFSYDNKTLLTGGKDKPALGELLQNFIGDSENNKGVSMRLWDIETGVLLQTFSGHTNDVNDVAFCADNKWIASCSSDKTVELWRLNSK